MSGIRVNEWLHNSGTGGIWQTSAGNVGIASSVPTAKLVVTGDANISGIATAETFVPTVGQLSHRNIIINGAMQVAQRGTTSGTEGYSTIDRFSNEEGSCDEVPTQSQHALTSSDTGPWAEGFRHSFHITNGNQTSGAQAANFIKLTYVVEAQDMASSGWNYTSTSSYITLSFWVKSSVAQNFYGRLRSQDGTSQNYPYETGSLTADTWTKVTKIIPGNSNLAFDNNNGAGLELEWMMYRGGNTTASGVALDTWAAYASGTRSPDQTSTWFTTNDATFEITGVQFEVGSVATPFEHRSYDDDLTRCQRYFQVFGGDVSYSQFGVGVWKSTTAANCNLQLMKEMRAAPTMTVVNPTDGTIRSGSSNVTTTTVVLDIASPKYIMYNANASSGGTDGRGSAHFGVNNTNCTLSFSAEF